MLVKMSENLLNVLLHAVAHVHPWRRLVQLYFVTEYGTVKLAKNNTVNYTVLLALCDLVWCTLVHNMIKIGLEFWSTRNQLFQIVIFGAVTRSMPTKCQCALRSARISLTDVMCYVTSGKGLTPVVGK